MNFDFVTIYVRDMEASVHFYHELLGLKLLRRHPIEDGELAFFGEEGKPTIEVISSPKHGIYDYAGFSIGIETKSLADTTKLLEENGHPRVRGPVSPEPDVSFSFFKDPSGVEIEVIEYKR